VPIFRVGGNAKSGEHEGVGEMFDRPVSLNESGENGITPRCFVQVPGFFFHSASSDGLDLTNLEH